MAIDRTTSAWLGLASAVLLTTACGQRPAANTAAEPGAAANGAAANQAAVAPTAPHPVTMEPDPANQTGPVARAVDADFPEPSLQDLRSGRLVCSALNKVDVDR